MAMAMETAHITPLDGERPAQYAERVGKGYAEASIQKDKKGNYIRVDYSYTLRLFPLKFDRILLSVPVSRNTRQALRAWFPCTGDDDS